MREPGKRSCVWIKTEDHPSQRCSMYRTLQPYKPLFQPPVHLRMIVENPNNFAPIISDAPLPLPLVNLAVALASKKVLPSNVLKFLYSYNMLRCSERTKKTLNWQQRKQCPHPYTSSTQQQKQILQGQVEQHGLLTHEANLLPPPTHIQLLQVSAPHCDETLLRIIKPQQNLCALVGGIPGLDGNPMIIFQHHFQKCTSFSEVIWMWCGFLMIFNKLMI